MATLTPVPKFQAFDANGNPLAGGLLYSYQAGTTTPLATYTDSTGGTPNANPVVLNARGEASVWLATAQYKLVLKDSTDVEIWTVDNIQGVSMTAFAVSLAGAADANEAMILLNGLQRVSNMATLRELAYANGRRVWMDYHTTEGWGGGPFRRVTGAAPGTYVHNGGTILVAAAGDGSAAWLRDTDQPVSVTDFGAVPDLGSGSDQSAAMQAAIDAEQEVFVPNGTYYCNLLINSKTHFYGLAQLRPYADAPIITLFGNNGTWLQGLKLDWTGVSTAWTAADGIQGGTGGSIDYVRIDNMEIRGSTAYGVYWFTTGGTGGGVVQRVHMRDCTVVDSAYANLRLEGVCLEHQYIGCFFNDGCSLSANPARSAYTTSVRAATPDREFRRGGVELLMEATGTAPVSVDTTLSPKRIIFIGGNFVPSRDWNVSLGADYRPAAVFIEAGRSVEILNSNIEKPNPGVEILKHPDQTNTSTWSVLGPIRLENNTLLMLSTDPTYYAAMYAEYVRGFYLQGNRLELEGSFATQPTAFLEWTESGGTSRSYIDLGHNVIPQGTRTAVAGKVGNNMKFFDPDGVTSFWVSSRQAATADDGVTAYSYLPVTGRMIVGKHTAIINIDALGSNGNQDGATGFTHGQRVTVRKSSGSSTLTLKNRTRDTTPLDVPGVLLLSADAILDDALKSVTLEWDEFAGDRGGWVEVGRNF